MNTVDLVRTAVRNTFRAKLRTSLTVLAIVVGAFTLTLTSGVGTGISNYIRTQVSSVGAADTMTVTKAAQASTGAGSGPKRWTADSVATAQTQGRPTGGALTAKDVTAIAAVQGITATTKNRAIAASWIEYGDHGKYQVVIDTTATSGADLAAGAQLDEQSSADAVLLPTTYLANLGFTSAKQAVGQTVTIGIGDYTGTIHEVTATVAGVQNASLFASGVSADGALRSQLISLQTTGTPARVATTYSSVTATYASTATATDVSAIKSRLADAGYSGETTNDQLGSILTVIDAIVGVLDAFAVIALIAAGFGIVNTLLMSVAERTREIGLMKAMGMGSGRVFALFSLEAVVIGFLGSAIGAAVAIVLGTVLSSVLANGFLSALPGLHLLQFTVPGVLSIVIAVMLIGFLAGTLPARRAARQNPIDALRYE